MKAYKILAGILHTLSCTKEHPDDMKMLLEKRIPDLCYFYLEESLTADEEMPDHAYWESQARELCTSLAITPEELLRILPQLLELRRRLDTVLLTNPNVREFAHLVLFDVRLSALS